MLVIELTSHLVQARRQVRELCNIFGASDSDADEIFQKLDRDGDGRVRSVAAHLLTSRQNDAWQIANT